MSKVVLTNAVITFQALDNNLTPSGPVYDFSDNIKNIVLSTVIAEQDITQVGEGYKRVIAGLGTNSVSFEFYQDFAMNSVEDIIYDWIGTRIQVTIKPVNAPTSTTNPAYQFTALVAEWQPLNAGVGQIATINVAWPISGPITKLTTP